MEVVQNEIAVRYLLGKLGNEEQASLETGYFQDTTTFENMLIAENSLIDSYVAGRLSPEDRDLFEKRLLISPHQRKRVAFAETFVNYASRQPMTDLESHSWLRAFSGLFSLRPLLGYSLTAAVVLFLAAGVYWWGPYDSARTGDNDLAVNVVPVEIAMNGQVADSDQTSANGADEEPGAVAKTEDAVVPPRAAEPSPAKKPKRVTISSAIVSTIILAAGSTRDSEAGRVFLVPANTGFVNLKLRFEDPRPMAYFAVVETADGQQVWRGKVSASRSNDSENTASVKLPATRLNRGDYVVSLKGMTKTGVYEPVADYSFTVDRR